jgi:hypothetical protein
MAVKKYLWRIRSIPRTRQGVADSAEEAIAALEDNVRHPTRKALVQITPCIFSPTGKLIGMEPPLLSTGLRLREPEEGA